MIDSKVSVRRGIDERWWRVSKISVLSQMSRRLSWTLTWTPSRRHYTYEPMIC